MAFRRPAVRAKVRSRTTARPTVYAQNRFVENDVIHPHSRYRTHQELDQFPGDTHEVGCRATVEVGVVESDGLQLCFAPMMYRCFHRSDCLYLLGAPFVYIGSHIRIHNNGAVSVAGGVGFGVLSVICGSLMAAGRWTDCPVCPVRP